MAYFCRPVINVLGVVLVAALIATETYARSGCASFGHSCYGGIGKRGELENTNAEIAQSNIQDSENPTYVFPEERNPSVGSNNPKPLRYNRLAPEQSEQINRYIRDWIINYLRKQQEIEQK